MLSDIGQKEAAREFAAYWKGKGYEKGESQTFWTSLLRDVYGVEHPEQFIRFEEQVHLDHTSFIDAMIPSTQVLIEQKGLGKDLEKPIRQSDGTYLTPFQQAKRYITELPVSQHPRWVVTCNFSTFRVYDMDRPAGDPEEILLENLEHEYYRLQFLVDNGNAHLQKEMEVSIAAGELVGMLYDALAAQYADPTSKESMESLNVLCVRLVFCLYAEDAGIFGKHGMFHDYLAGFDTRKMRRAVIDLFKTLDTSPEDRDPYLKDDSPELAEFPYVNGGLFRDEDIEIPPFTDAIKDLLLNKASDSFDWSEISPTIFGAVFESTLNPETRRSGGMHYTSIENIHKVIDPLFLDDLRGELKEICGTSVYRTKKLKLKNFQKKLSNLRFLDPACGSGNFLTETYICLRRLENEVLRQLEQGQISFVDENWNPIQVSISQFYGIEINDFAVTVAKTALWIAESQMMKETEGIIMQHLDFLPLKTNAHIIEGNALQMDWESVIPKTELSYIMGNPPFVGTKNMNPIQKRDAQAVLSGWKNYGTLDYVACWYKKAADYILNTSIECAYVSTNSICQGEQVVNLWKPIFSSGICINFAYRTFQWDSEANLKAHVHCIIVGFSLKNKTIKKLFSDNRMTIAQNINPYLVNAGNIFVVSRKTPISDVPKMFIGCEMKDDGNYVMSEEEKDILLSQEPQAAKFVHPYMMGKDFIARKPRYCLWLKDANPTELKRCPHVLERVKKVRDFRINCPSLDTQHYAEKPTYPVRLRYYSEERTSSALALPKVSSQNRRYIPMEVINPDVIAGSKLFLIPDISLYHFGVLTSNVHMAWMRTVCGRLKSDYSYASNIVYNTFPWPEPSDKQKAQIEKTAQAILDARELYPDSSLADLYDDVAMPPELRRAHQDNDRAVMRAYGFKIKGTSESNCVAALMELYQKKIIELGN